MIKQIFLLLLVAKLLYNEISLYFSLPHNIYSFCLKLLLVLTSFRLRITYFNRILKFQQGILLFFVVASFDENRLNVDYFSG